MFVLKILPILIFVLQLASVVHLYIINKTENAHVPVVFIELNIIVIVNIIVFLTIYFFIHKIKVESFWILPLFILVILIIFLLFFYIRMLF